MSNENKRESGDFSLDVAAYDAWYDDHLFAFQSEIEAIRIAVGEEHLDSDGRMKLYSLEVGAGTGRFTGSLGISVGIDSSESMVSFATRKGLPLVFADALSLPFLPASFDVVLFIASLCFIDNVKAALAEANRVLRTGGRLVVGMIDPDSGPGSRIYDHSRTLQGAGRLDRGSLEELARESGFGGMRWWQTLFHDIEAMDRVDPVLEGAGEGAFAILRAMKR